MDTVARLLTQRAAQSPDLPAFRFEADGQWATISWREFEARVDRLRRALAATGLERGDRLGIIAAVSLEWELLHHAALSMGVSVVGLDAHDLPERIADMVEQADIAAFATTAADALSRVSLSRLARAHFVLHWGKGERLPETACRTLAWKQLEDLASDKEPPPACGDDEATVIFTSGTTGAPKGIPYRHDQMCLAVDAIRDAFSFVSGDARLLCWLPLSNLFQRMVNLAGMRQGVCSYLLSDPRRVMDVVAQVSPDIFIGVPRFFEKLQEGISASIQRQPRWRRHLISWAQRVGHRAAAFEQRQTPMPWRASLLRAIADRLVLRRVRAVMGNRLRCMVSGSAPMPLPLLESFHGLGWMILEAYGLSENVLPMAMNRIDAYRFGTVGKPLSANEIRIDADGSIRVRGPGVFTAYLGADSPAVRDDEGFYRTGDLGRVDDQGFLRLTGRTSEIIKTSTGRRIAPASVEAELRRVPGLDHAMLVGDGRKCLVALCTYDPAALAAVDRERVASNLRQVSAEMGDQERPLAIALLPVTLSIDRGELTPNLKLRRATILARYGSVVEDLYARVEQAPAGNRMEPLLIWSEL